MNWKTHYREGDRFRHRRPVSQRTMWSHSIVLVSPPLHVSLTQFADDLFGTVTLFRHAGLRSVSV